MLTKRARRKVRIYEPLTWGHFALITGFATIALFALWAFSGRGRGESLGSCFPDAPWLQGVIGILFITAYGLTVVLAAVSFFGASRWWGISAIVLPLICAPTILGVALLLLFGDPGVGTQRCIVS